MFRICTEMPERHGAHDGATTIACTVCQPGCAQPTRKVGVAQSLRHWPVISSLVRCAKQSFLAACELLAELSLLFVSRESNSSPERSLLRCRWQQLGTWNMLSIAYRLVKQLSLRLSDNLLRVRSSLYSKSQFTNLNNLN